MHKDHNANEQFLKPSDREDNQVREEIEEGIADWQEPAQQQPDVVRTTEDAGPRA